jgi:hypothetical protein
MKTIVTHIGPDLDAVAAIWLIKLYVPGWEEAGLAFVPAGLTLEGKAPDENPDIIHVDVGSGKFDHHQLTTDTCAAKLVFESLGKEDEALRRLIDVVNDIDHFREAFFPNPTADFWNLGIHTIIDGWRLTYADDPLKLVSVCMDCLDGAYRSMQSKVWAEKDIEGKGQIFETPWGKGLGVETVNDEVIHLGQKMGYRLVVRKDPNKGYVRVKALPVPEINLAKAFEMLKSKDPSATWFLHASNHMILNGSTKNPDMKPTKLTLQELMDCLKK